MAFDTKVRVLWAVLAIPGVLLGIGASYKSGGLAGLRELTSDTLQWVGIQREAPYHISPNLPSHERAATTPSVPLSADEIFWLSIKDSNVSALFEEFLAKFPASPRAQEARAKLQGLKKAAPQHQTLELPPGKQMPERRGAPMMMQPNSN
jgi:hypothetical protein